jgi:hypothetical protein
VDRRSSLSVLAGILLTQGCALTNPDFGPKHLEEAGASPEAGSCPLGHWLHGDLSVPDEGDLLFVQRTVDLGDLSGDAGPDAWTPADWPIPAPCTNPVSQMTMTANLNDNGRSALGQTSYELTQGGVVTLSNWFNQVANGGNSATLIRLVGYNGQADDDRVEVDLGQGSSLEPAWKGTDVWLPFSNYAENVGNGYRPRMFTATGQVHGGVLDASMDASSSPPYVRPIRLHATIRRDSNNRWRLSGEASGWVLTRDLLQLNPNVGACPNQPNYPKVMDVECSHADIDKDGDGICDSLSDAWTLDAEDARLGCMQPPQGATCPATDAQPGDCTGGPTPGAVSPPAH